MGTERGDRFIEGVLRARSVAEKTQDHGNTGASETFDFVTAGAHLCVIDVNCAFTFTGAVAGYRCALTVRVVQPASSGTKTISFINTVRWTNGSGIVQPATGNNAVTEYVFVSFDGSTWDAGISGYALA